MSATKTTVIATIVVVLTFVSGVFVGIFADRLLLMHGAGFGFGPGPGRPRPPRFAAHMLVNRLDRQLELTDAQREQVEQILERRHDRVLHLWSEVDPRVRAEIEGANAEIAKILTPEQREKFEKMKLGIHSLHRARRAPPPPPPH